MKTIEVMLRSACLSFLFLVALPSPRLVAQQKPDEPSAVAKSESSEATRYVFGWGDLPEKLADPRGGTTKGADVTLAPATSLPLPLIAAATTDLDRDRAAILSMAGDYRVSFHFLESLGLTADYKPVRPYHSWATERVDVLTNDKHFISLQHTLVMYFQEDDGTISEPSLTKHWRQDWSYEDTDVHLYRGDATWERSRRTPEEVAGTWTQTVAQVDDSPRYAATGRWEHRGNVSEWRAAPFWRPLPRREHTVRKDYNVLEGRDVIVITPTGWLHEQHNWKRLVEGAPSGPPVYVASELGLNRYDRITAPDLGAAQVYWDKTGDYWAMVRRLWTETFSSRDQLTLQREVEGEALYEHLFGIAEDFEDGKSVDLATAEAEVKKLMEAFAAAAE